MCSVLTLLFLLTSAIRDGLCLEIKLDSSERNRNMQLKRQFYFKLGEVLHSWHPDFLSEIGWEDSRAHPMQKKNIIRFNYSDTQDRMMALECRQNEIPFVIYDVHSLKKTIDVWTDSYLLGKFGTARRFVEKSIDNKFTYYSTKRIPHEKYRLKYNWTAPQDDVSIIIFMTITTRR